MTQHLFDRSFPDFCKKFIAIAWTTVALIATGCKARKFGNGSSVKLISAEKPVSDEVPAGNTNFDPKFTPAVRVNLGEACSSTIIGKHAILTALHCVVPLQEAGESSEEEQELATERTLQKVISEDYKPGDFIDFDIDREVKLGSKIIRLKSLNVEGFPSAFNALPAKESVFATTGVPDLAMIFVEEDLSSIGSISPNFESLKIGEPIVISGWGCEFDNRSSIASTTPRFKTAENEVIDYAKLKGIQPESFKADLKSLPIHYFYSGGFGLGADKPKSVNGNICAGDSGGGVYLKNASTDRIEIVGVNSSGVLKNGSPFIAAGAHVRLSNVEVQNWIKAGLTMVPPRISPLVFKRNFMSCLHKRVNLQNRFLLGMEFDNSGKPNRISSQSYLEPKLTAKIDNISTNGNEVVFTTSGTARFRNSDFETVTYSVSEVKVANQDSNKGTVSFKITDPNGTRETLEIPSCDLNFDSLKTTN